MRATAMRMLLEHMQWKSLVRISRVKAQPHSLQIFLSVYQTVL